MKAVLYCEGETEMRMVEGLLKPFLSKLGWRGHLAAKNMENSAQFIRKIGRAVENVLSLNSADHVFGLIDLYGTTISFPSGVHLPQERATFLRDYLKGLVPNTYKERFHPHVAVHELEAWLLADETALSERLKHSVPAWASPENVNFDKPPAQHLNDLFRRHLKKAYGKATDGGSLFRKVNPQIVLSKCPHFKLFVDDLMAVA